jgi:hypothetical protein
MPKSKKTPWFDGSVKPVRPGVYERRLSRTSQVRFARWIYGAWRSPALTAEQAAAETNQSMFQPGGLLGFKWRGLAEEPK